MQKDRLVELHSKLYTIHSVLEDLENQEKSLPETEPDDIHKSKSHHKHAIFLMGENIADMLNDDSDEFSDIGRLEARMEEKKEASLA